MASIMGMLSKDFLKQVLVALLIAAPIAWYVAHQWLENFAHRIEWQWWVFVMAAVPAILIAGLTVSVQSMRAALANPVEALRDE